MDDIEVWTDANLIYWLDINLRQPDISQGQMAEWLRQIIEHLTATRKLPLASLVIAKFALLNKLKSLVNEARQSSFDFFLYQSRKELDFKNGFEFKKGMYNNIGFLYTGKYRFTKHYLSIIPAMDSAEEQQCAEAIDQNDSVLYWLRNAAKAPASFWLPTRTDKFYPDFVARLKDGRTLVIEYKGEDRASNDDTKEKVNMGELWETESNGSDLFLLAVKSKNRKPLAEQISEKIGKK